MRIKVSAETLVYNWNQAIQTEKAIIILTAPFFLLPKSK